MDFNGVVLRYDSEEDHDDDDRRYDEELSFLRAVLKHKKRLRMLHDISHPHISALHPLKIIILSFLPLSHRKEIPALLLL